MITLCAAQRASATASLAKHAARLAASALDKDGESRVLTVPAYGALTITMTTGRIKVSMKDEGGRVKEKQSSSHSRTSSCILAFQRSIAR